MKAGVDVQKWREPFRIWLIVLTTTFATEVVIMVVLPWILPASPSRLLEATVDAMLLTFIVAPLLWILLVRPLQEANQARAAFLADLFDSIEADRRQTAHDLHDGIGQSLTLLVSGLRSALPETHEPETVQRLQHWKQLAKQALIDVKRLALGLRPSLLDDLGLAPALERIATDVRLNHPVAIELDIENVVDLRMPGPMETALFRITQEALTNIVTHSNAAHATITIRIRNRDPKPGTLELEILDDGIGIPLTKQSGRNPGHLGLTGMRERATLLGGEMLIDSLPNRGTRLFVQLPIREA